MTVKSAIYALAVAVLMGTMAVAALADDQWMDSYGAAGDSYSSSQPEPVMNHANAGEIREPVETGSVPDRLEGSSDLFRQDTGEEPVVEIGGQLFRPSTDTGP